MTVKLLTEHNLELLRLTGGCTGSSEYTHVKTPHFWKSNVVAHIYFRINYSSIVLFLQDLNTNVFNAMVIEVMRWLKKATTDNHEDLQKLTFRILKGISQFYLTSLKDVFTRYC